MRRDICMSLTALLLLVFSLVTQPYVNPNGRPEPDLLSFITNAETSRIRLLIDELLRIWEERE